MAKRVRLKRGTNFAPPIPKAPRVTAATRRRIKLRGEFWPDIDKSKLWDRKDFTGFTTVPRTLPMIMRIIDGLDAKNAGRAYLDLWCRAFDDYMVDIRDEAEASYQAGYTGQRAVRTWRERIDVLEQFGFIKLRKGPNGTYHYILILEPHQVADRLHTEGKVSDDDYGFLRTHMINIGAI